MFKHAARASGAALCGCTLSATHSLPALCLLTLWWTGEVALALPHLQALTLIRTSQKIAERHGGAEPQLCGCVSLKSAGLSAWQEVLWAKLPSNLNPLQSRDAGGAGKGPFRLLYVQSCEIRELARNQCPQETLARGAGGSETWPCAAAACARLQLIQSKPQMAVQQASRAL